MHSHLYHLQLNIDLANKDFYKELMEFLGWDLIFDAHDMMGYKTKHSGDVWFIGVKDKDVQDYDSRGLNHLAIKVSEQKNIDEVVEFIVARDIKPLFETPRHREEFATSETETYYQVMFESPDKILFEMVYIGPKQN